MKIGKYILFFLILTSIVNGQSISNEEKFVIEQFKAKKNIIYTDKIWPSDIDNIREALSAKSKITTWDYRRNKEKDEDIPNQINFTNSELKFVLKQIEKNNKKGWAKNKLPNDQFISRDSLTALSKKGMFFNEYSFSKPVFIRNETICIFYSDGNEFGELSVFIKHKDNWIYYSRFFQWVS